MLRGASRMVDARRELQSCDSSTVPPLLTDGGTAAGCIERGFENGFMNVLEDPAALNALKDEKAEHSGKQKERDYQEEARVNGW